MARSYSLGTIAKLDKLENFVMLLAQCSNYSNSSKKLVYPGSVTLYILAAIGTTNNSRVRDITAGVNIYTMASANTIYSAPSNAPLASYNYPAGNEVSTVDSSNTEKPGAMAGFIGMVPTGFFLQGVGGYVSATTTPGTININPTTTRPYSVWGYALAISVNPSPYDNPVTVIMRISGGTIIEKMFSPHGVTYEKLKTGTNPIITVSPGQNLVIEAYTNSYSASALVAGVILYKT